MQGVEAGNIMDKKSALIADMSQGPFAERDGGFDTLISAIEHSRTEVANLSAAALTGVLNGIITGEGPTAAGRVHFTRTLDRGDAMLCERILMAAGGEAGAAVRRIEADVLFDIDAAAAERTDNGRFDSLLIKSVAHCVLSESGQKVPPRQVALAPSTLLASWANGSANGQADRDVDSEILVWIASHVHNRKRLKSTLMGLSAVLTGIGASLSSAAISGAAPSISTIVDMIS
jgi:hypothetical protein